MVIWKYPLTRSPEESIPAYVEVNAPLGAVPIHVAEQDGIPTVWMVLNPEMPLDWTIIRVYGTGEDIDRFVVDDLEGKRPGRAVKYIGTIHRENGNVWHVFQEPAR